METLEGELDGPSYTWRTLREWGRRHEGEELPYFMMGAESFAALDTWKHGLELPHFAHLVMVPRNGDDGSVFHESIRTFWPAASPTTATCPWDAKPCPSRAADAAPSSRAQTRYQLNLHPRPLARRSQPRRSPPEAELRALNARAAEVSACWATARVR